MITWYIFRHGLAIPAGAEYGDRMMTAPLLPEGRPAIKRLAAFLQTQPRGAAFTSPVARCVQSAEIVTAATEQNFQVDERITEYNPATETFAQLRERVQHFIDTMSLLNSETVWVCTHGADISALKNLLLTGEYPENKLLDFTEPGALMIVRGKKLEVKDFNP